jgi:hypothetical protein
MNDCFSYDSNAVAVATWGMAFISKQAHTAEAHFTVAVQSFNGVKLKRNFNVNMFTDLWSN